MLNVPVSKNDINTDKADNEWLQATLVDGQTLCIEEVKRADSLMEIRWPQADEYRFGCINYAIKLIDGLQLLSSIRPLVVELGKEEEYDSYAESTINLYSEEIKALTIPAGIEPLALKQRAEQLYHTVRRFVEGFQQYLNDLGVKIQLKQTGNLEVVRPKLYQYLESKYKHDSTVNSVGAWEPQKQALIQTICYQFITSDYMIQMSQGTMVEKGKSHYLRQRTQPLTPVISVSGAPELRYNSKLEAAIPEEERRQLELGRDTLLTQISEQGRKKPTVEGEMDYGVLSDKQLEQYLTLHEKAIVSVDPETKKLSVKLDEPPIELFWFYLMPRVEQLEMVRWLERLHREAETIAKGQSNAGDNAAAIEACFRDLVSTFYGSNGHISKRGPGIHNGRAKRFLAHTKNESGVYEKAYDSHPYLPCGVPTNGVPSRTTAMLPSRLISGDPLIYQQYIEFAMDNIEQDIERRLQAVAERRLHDLSDRFVRQEEIRLSATRTVVNLLSPGRYDVLMRYGQWLFGGSHSNDNALLTLLLEAACRQLRDQYRYRTITVPVVMSTRRVIKVQFEVNFAIHTKGINNIRKSSVLGWLQVDTDHDSSSYVAFFHQLAADFSLYAEFSIMPAYRRYGNALRALSTLFLELATVVDVSLIELSVLEDFSAQVDQLKQVMQDVRGKNRQVAQHMALRADAMLNHLLAVNVRCEVSALHNLEALSNSLLIIALDPEGLTYNCFSGNDRAGSVEHSHEHLIYYWVKTGSFPPLSDSKKSDQSPRNNPVPQSMQPYFYSYDRVFWGGGHKLRVRHEGCTDVAIKSFPGAHPPGAGLMTKYLIKKVQALGYSGPRLKDNKRAAKMSKHEFELAWYVRYCGHPLLWIAQQLLCCSTRGEAQDEGSEQDSDVRELLVYQRSSGGRSGRFSTVVRKGGNEQLWQRAYHQSYHQSEGASMVDLESGVMAPHLRWHVELALAALLHYHQVDPFNMDIRDWRSFPAKLLINSLVSALAGLMHFCWAGNFNTGGDFYDDWADFFGERNVDNTWSVMVLSFVCYGLSYCLFSLQVLIKHYEAYARSREASRFLVGLEYSNNLEQEVINPFFGRVHGFNPVAVGKARQQALASFRSLPVCPTGVISLQAFDLATDTCWQRASAFLDELMHRINEGVKRCQKIPGLGVVVGLVILAIRLAYLLLQLAVWPLQNKVFSAFSASCAYSFWQLVPTMALACRQQEGMDSPFFEAAHLVSAAIAGTLLFYHCQRADGYHQKYDGHLRATVDAVSKHPIYGQQSNRSVQFQRTGGPPQDIKSPLLN